MNNLCSARSVIFKRSMRLNKIFIISALLLQIALRAQPADTLRQVMALPVRALWATGDNLGNSYVVTTPINLEKYAPDGRLLARYSNSRLGAISAIDASNPLKILAWFADFRTVVMLDRSLTALGELNLISSGYPDVRTIASSADGNLWLYDETAFKLRKLGLDGTQLFESQDLSLLFPSRLNIACLRDDGTQLLAADPEQGLIWFDTYAQFSRVAPLAGIRDFQRWGENIVWWAGGALHRYDFRSFQEKPLAMPVETNQGVWLGPGELFVQHDDRLLIFAW